MHNLSMLLNLPHIAATAPDLKAALAQGGFFTFCDHVFN